MRSVTQLRWLVIKLYRSSYSCHLWCRSISAPVNYKDLLDLPLYAEFDDIFLNEAALADIDGQKFISYNEDKTSEQQTESDMKNLEGKINMSLQQIKEKIFSSVSCCFILLLALVCSAGIQLGWLWTNLFLPLYCLLYLLRIMTCVLMLRKPACFDIVCSLS